jgi:class I fructose-bisphosphate aldolase
MNHNELLTYPNKADQILFGTIEEAWNLGAAAVGATIYFGSEESGRQITEIAETFAQAHQLGMATILWCYLRNPKFKVEGKDYHLAADLTGQANHLGVTIQADIIKQKLPERNAGYKALNTGSSSYGKLDERMYSGASRAITQSTCAVTRFSTATPAAAASSTRAARARAPATSPMPCAPPSSTSAPGGTGLISGRKAFQRPMNEGIKLLNAIQDVYLDERVTVA